MNEDITRLAAVTADENGEHPGDVEAAAGSLPWTMDEDGTKWRAQLPDGRTAVIERLEDGDEDGNGASFLPRVGEAAGPMCAGLLGAGAWVAEYAAESHTIEQRVGDLEQAQDETDDALTGLSDRVDTLAANSWGRDSTTELMQHLWRDGYEKATEKLVHRLDALEVRIEELESARATAV